VSSGNETTTIVELSDFILSLSANVAEIPNIDSGLVQVLQEHLIKNDIADSASDDVMSAIENMVVESLSEPSNE
jgi:hypothetical protein